MEQFFTVPREFDQHFAAVLVAVPANHRPVLHEAIDQLHRTVMAQAEPLRKRPYSGTSPLGQSFHGEKKLVLLRFDSLRPSGFLA